VAFSADQLVYEETSDTVTATGQVRMNREGYNLRADSVTWDRHTGQVHANGDVRVLSPGGDVAYADSVQLEDTLKDGVVQNLLLVLADGGRLAATEATRRNGYTTLYHAAYTPCAVTTPEGCPKSPTWQINAVRVVHDPVRHRISYQGATLNLFGMPLLGLPGLSHPDGTQGGGTGFLVPEIRYSRRNGVALSAPYYVRFSSNRDLTVTPHVYTGVLPMLEAEYRQLTSLGAFDVHGYLTYGSLLQLDPLAQPLANEHKAIRGYIEGSGRLILSPTWTVTAAGRYASDRTFMLRHLARRSVALDGRRGADYRRLLYLDRRLGLRRAAGHRRRRHAADRPARDRRALADRRSDIGRPDRAPGQQPLPVPAARPGHAARLRQRDLAAPRHHAAGPGAGADRLCARRRLPCQRHAAHPDGQLPRR
jgi:lipopolysaccharide assembly outer membrane protein LptD (OstA)